MAASPALRDRLRHLGPGGGTVLLLALALTGLNALKPLHIDDPFMLRVAERAASHPLDPYGFDILWVQWPQPVYEELTPPVLPYWWAAGLRLFGDGELLGRIWLAPFALLLVGSLHALLRRFASGAATPLTAFAVLGPAVLPGFNAMQDVPAAGLALAGLVLYLRAFDRDSLSGAALAGLVAGLAAQTKYGAVALIAVALLHGLLARRVRVAVVSVAVAALTFSSWEWAMGLRYGEGMLVGQLRQELFWYARSGMVLPLLRLMGGTLPVLGLVGFATLGAPRGLVRGVGVLVAVGFALLLAAPVEEPLYTVLGAGVAAVSVACASRLLRRESVGGVDAARGADWLIVGWVLIELAVYFAASPFPAVRRVMGLGLALTVLVGRAWMRSARPPLTGLAACGVGLGLLVFGVDLAEARAQRDIVPACLAAIGTRAPAESVWFVGHWGFQHYAERAGMRPVVPDTSVLRAGDWLVVPDGIDQQRIELTTDDAEPAGRVARAGRVPLRTGYGYYGGAAPLAHLPGTRLVARLFRVRRDVVPTTAWTPDALADWVFAAKGRTAAAALPAVIRELGRADTAPRRRLARAVAELGALGAPAVPVLSRALADPDVEVRYWAAVALSRIGAPAAPARDALASLAADPDPAVRQAAAAALAAIGP